MNGWTIYRLTGDELKSPAEGGSRASSDENAATRTELLCRNKVEDLDRWKTVFESHASAHTQAGLELMHVWCDSGDPDGEVHFLHDPEAHG